MKMNKKVVLIGFKDYKLHRKFNKVSFKLENRLDRIDKFNSRIKFIRLTSKITGAIVVNLNRDESELRPEELLLLQNAYTNKTPIFGYGYDKNNLLKDYIQRIFPDLLGLEYAITGAMLESEKAVKDI